MKEQAKRVLQLTPQNDKPRDHYTYPEEFEQLWSAYPKRPNNPKLKAFKALQKRLKEGHSLAEITEGLNQYGRYCRLRGMEHTEHVMQAATFFGPDLRWQEDFPIPKRFIRLPSDDSKLGAFAQKHGLKIPKPGVSMTMNDWRYQLKQEIRDKNLIEEIPE